MSNSQKTAVLVQLPDGTIIQSSGLIKRLLGYSQRQLIGKKPDELGLHFVLPDGRPLPTEALPFIQIFREKKEITPSVLGIFNTTSQTLKWVQVCGRPGKVVNGNVLTASTTYNETSPTAEISSAVSDFSGSGNIWEKTFDALQDVITILTPDLRVVRANKATFITFGITEVELIGRHCYEVFQGKDEPCHDCPVWQPTPSKTTDTSLIFNERLNKTFDVSSSPVFNKDGSVQFLIHSARDVTQKLITTDQRNMFSAAIEQINESVVLTDDIGKIRYVNSSYTQTTGYSFEEVFDQDLSYLNINTDSAPLFREIYSTLRDGKSWQGRLTSRRKDDTIFEEYATISPVINNAGKISNFVAVKRDITQEEELRIQLQQAVKMEAIGTLASGIAHDFNNILSAMIGYGQIAKGRLEQNDPLLADIEQILQAGDRAANLVKQILAFCRHDTQENFLPVKLQYIVKEVTNLLRSSFPATIEISKEINSSCDPIMADPGQLHQVLMNLCTNAKQAIGDNHGRLTLRLDEIEVNEPQMLSGAVLLTSGKYAHLAVEDNGVGMSQEIKERIFDPFFTTKSINQGTGLGLSVVQGIVEKHGGYIRIDSQEDVGSTFNLYFPIVDLEATKEAESSEQDQPGTERVMLIEDEAMLAKVMSRMLSKLGYKVTIFTDSLKAVKEYRRNPYDFDVVITDMTMPHMTGAELAREVLSLRPELPIIMTTGYSESIDEERSKRIGITTFMLKPVKKKPLAKELRKVLDNV